MADQSHSSSSSQFTTGAVPLPAGPSIQSKEQASGDQYATFDDLFTAVDIMKKKMESEFGVTRELLRNIEQGRYEKDVVARNLLGRVEEQMKLQDQKLDETINMVKKWINYQNVRLEKRIMTLEAQLEKTETGFRALEECFKGEDFEEIVDTPPVTPVLDSRRTFKQPLSAETATPGPSTTTRNVPPEMSATSAGEPRSISRGPSPYSKRGPSTMAASGPVHSSNTTTVVSQSSSTSGQHSTTAASRRAPKKLRREDALFMGTDPRIAQALDRPEASGHESAATLSQDGVGPMPHQLPALRSGQTQDLTGSFIPVAGRPATRSSTKGKGKEPAHEPVMSGLKRKRGDAEASQETDESVALSSLVKEEKTTDVPPTNEPQVRNLRSTKRRREVSETQHTASIPEDQPRKKTRKRRTTRK